MRTFNELSEAYERNMLARAEPKKENKMEKPKDAEVYDWDQFLEVLHSCADSVKQNWEGYWEFWKEGYTAGIESATEEDD